MLYKRSSIKQSKSVIILDGSQLFLKHDSPKYLKCFKQAPALIHANKNLDLHKASGKRAVNSKEGGSKDRVRKKVFFFFLME